MRVKTWLAGGSFLRRSLPAMIVCVGLLPSAWVLLRFRDTPQLGFLLDDVMYIGAAQSLADTGAYREAALPGNFRQTKYPPGYPLLLAVILKLHPVARNFWIVAHSWLWLFAACITLAWAMTETGLSRLQSATVAALWAANPTAAFMGTSAMSEAPYCAVLFAAIGWAQRSSGARTAPAAVCGSLLGVACILRTVGILAGAAVVIWLVWRRRFRAALWVAACSAVLPGIWMYWSHAHLPPDGDFITRYYFNYGGAWLEAIRSAGPGVIIRTNFLYGVMALGGWLIASNSLLFLRIARDLFLIAIGAAALADWTGGAFTAIAMVSIVFHLGYNFTPDPRFLMPMAPALLAALTVKLSPRYFIVRACAIAIVVVADIYGTAALAAGYSSQRERLNAYAPVYNFIRTQLPADAVILGGEEHVWLRTGRRVIGMPVPMDYFYLAQIDSGKAEDEELDRIFLRYRDAARTFGAGYLMLSPWGMGTELNALEKRERFLATVRSDPDLDRVFSSNGIELFRIVR